MHSLRTVTPARLHASALLTHIVLHRAHTHIQHMPLPFQPTLCALSFSLSSSHVSKLLKHLPAVTSRALVPATFQYISLSAGGRKKRTKIQKSESGYRVFSSLAAEAGGLSSHINRCSDTQASTSLVWKRVVSLRDDYDREIHKTQCSPIDEQLEKRRSRLWARGSGGRKREVIFHP